MPNYYRLIGYCDGAAYAINPMTDDLGPLCRDLPEKLLEFPVRWDGDIYLAIETAKAICRWAEVPDGSAFIHRFDRIEVLRRYSGDRVAWTNGQVVWKWKPM